MFSLIVTLVATALVVALALATLYFGGEFAKDGRAQSDAVAVINHGQQLLAAADLFAVSNGRWPASTEELLSGSYLSSMPRLSGTETGWTQLVSGQPAFVLASGVSEATCRAVNRKTRGDDGILLQAYPGFATQCFGTSATALKVVATKVALSDVLQASEVASGPLPAPTDSGSWLVVPGYRQSESGSTTPPAPPVSNTMTFNVYATPLAGEAWEPRYRIALSHVSGAPLSELNPYNPAAPEADDILVVNFGGYTNYVSHGSTVNLLELDLAYGYWSENISQRAPAGTEIGFTISQQYGVLDTLNGVNLVSNGADSQSWCVTLTRDPYTPTRWIATEPVQPGGCY